MGVLKGDGIGIRHQFVQHLGAVSQLRLGNLYWKTERYADAKRCYGEAIGLLDQDRKDYPQLAHRSKVLDELVPYTEAIALQDSLQSLAKMDEKDRNAAIDRVIAAQKDTLRAIYAY